MMGKTLRFIGTMRAVDATVARCNFRRFPLPVSGMRAPFFLTQRQWAAVAVLCLIAGVAAGIALGVTGYAHFHLNGLLP